MRKIKLHHQAEKSLDRLDRTTAARVRAKIEELAANPLDDRISKELIMEPGQRYSRVGNWRIVYQVDEEGGILFVTAIQHRSRIYRKN